MSDELGELSVPMDVAVELILDKDEEELPELLRGADSSQLRSLSNGILEQVMELSDEPYENEERIKEYSFKMTLVFSMSVNPALHWESEEMSGHSPSSEEQEDADKDEKQDTSPPKNHNAGLGISALKEREGPVSMKDALSRIRERRTDEE